MHALTEPVVTGVPGQDAGGQAGSLARRMIPVCDLIAHHGNVREDLNLTEEFIGSIAAEGVRIPLLITTTPDGGWRVIEGHRRLAAAVKAGVTEVPCDIDQGRAGDEAGQYLDMLLANSDAYRTNYTVVEETAALFAAHEAGASRTRLRKATGRTAAHIKTVLTAGQLSAETRTRAAKLNCAVTLEDLALLADFDGDTEATGTLLLCLQRGYGLEHAAERIRQDRAEAAEHAKVRADLEASDVPVTDTLPDGAMWLTSLRHEEQGLTAEAHAACPGHGATFQRWNLLEPAWYCASPAEHGHASRRVLPGRSEGDTSTSGAQPDPASTQPEPMADPSRKLVITGNKAWQAAGEVRHRWLAASFFPRRSLPREASEFLTRQFLSMPVPLRTGLATAAGMSLFAKLTGHDAGHWETECGTATNGRLAVIMFGPVITAYEHAMTDGEGRNTWRADRYSPCPRTDAGRYLTFVASLGYQLSDIEQAVADGSTYTGDAPVGHNMVVTGSGDADGDADAESAGDAASGSQGDPGENPVAA